MSTSTSKDHANQSNCERHRPQQNKQNNLCAKGHSSTADCGDDLRARTEWRNKSWDCVQMQSHIFQTAIRGILESFFYNCETSNFTIARHSRSVFVAPGSSAELSVTILLKQSITPLYAVRPDRSATCMHVLMTSAGVTGEAAGTAIQQMYYNAK